MDFTQKYTFTIEREYTNGHVSKTVTESNTENLSELLSVFADFVRGSGFTYVFDITAVHEDGTETLSGDEWNHDSLGTVNELTDLINDLMSPGGEPTADVYTLDLNSGKASKLSNNEQKKVDDMLDNIFKSNKPKGKK